MIASEMGKEDEVNLKGKIALITGASSGIGKALALELARRGCHLALTSRRQEELEAVAQLARTHGVNVQTYPCDTRDRAQVRAVAQQVLTDFKRIDLVILSAGVRINTMLDPFDAGHVVETFHTNVLGAIYWIEALLPSMQARRAGIIVGLSSLAADRGLPRSAAYSASKAALSTFLESLRVDLRSKNIRIITVAPGFVRTPMTAKNGKMPFLMEADQASRLIVRGIEKGKPIIRFPWQTALLSRLARALPVRLYDALLSRIDIKA